MRLLGIELHSSTMLEGLAVIWIGEILDWEIRRIPRAAKHLSILCAGLALEIVLEIESMS